MRQIFRVFLAVIVLTAESAVADENDVFFDYQVVTTERCDGVIMEKQFLPADDSTGSTAIVLPNNGRIIYGAFEHGEVIEFGYIDQEPIFNEDIRFDWGAWVNEQLERHGYAPWFDNPVMIADAACGDATV